MLWKLQATSWNFSLHAVRQKWLKMLSEFVLILWRHVYHCMQIKISTYLAVVVVPFINDIGENPKSSNQGKTDWSKQLGSLHWTEHMLWHQCCHSSNCMEALLFTSNPFCNGKKFMFIKGYLSARRQHSWNESPPAVRFNITSMHSLQ